MLNSVEASTQPCLTSFVTGNGSENSPSFWTLASIPSWNCRTIAMNGRTAKLCHNFPKSLTTDCVKCFGKVDKGHVEVHTLFLAFSWSCRAVKIISIVSLSFLNPHWLSCRSPVCSRCSFNRFSRTLVRIFPAIHNKEMPRWLSQTWGFPFLLNRWIIVASLNSWGMASFLHIMWNNSVSFSATGGPPAL